MKNVPAFVSSSILAATLAAGVALAPGAHADDPPRPHGPPPEAYAACDSKAEGDACTVQFHDREIHGSCQKDREDKELFCLPKDLPPPPPDDSH